MDLTEENLAELTALAGVAVTHEDLNDALREICRIAARAIGKAEGATLTMFSPTGPQVAAASDEWAGELDQIQYEEHEGPCLDAARTGALFRVRDLSEESRWPSYAPRACELGASSVLSIPMTVESKTIGALNIYAREPDAFTPDDVSVAEVIAGHASLATQVTATLQGHRELAEQLRTAMASRAAIEQAKGIMMATLGVSADEAFQRLVEQSQHENRKLRDLAESLVRRYGREERERSD